MCLRLEKALHFLLFHGGDERLLSVALWIFSKDSCTEALRLLSLTHSSILPSLEKPDSTVPSMAQICSTSDFLSDPNMNKTAISHPKDFGSLKKKKKKSPFSMFSSNLENTELRRLLQWRKALKKMPTCCLYSPLPPPPAPESSTPGLGIIQQ